MRSRAARFVSWGLGVSIAFALGVPIAACEDDVTITPPNLEFEAGAPSTTPPSQRPVDASLSDAPDLSDAGVDAQADSAPPPACNDGKIDPGETCDPLASCPTSCPPVACQLRTLENAGTCTAACKDGAMQTQCINGDGCCPPTCNANNDDDCKAKCDNGVIEGAETCDPLASCPTTCPAIGCQLRTLQNAGTCTAACVSSGNIIACVNGDGCCPAACNATNDSDCQPGCGNNVIEPGETCDPLASCPTKCAPNPQNACMLRKLINANTCQAQCVDDALQTQCINNDGCCPPGCNANTDNDCKPVCDNSVVEPGETCDPLASCPSTCPQQGCQLYKLENPKTCQAVCSPSAIQTACINGDGCCPAGCNANNDNDCTAKCDNGVVEPGETCDPIASCPKCATPAYACQVNKGSPKTCDVACNVPILTCGDSDSCCPYQTAAACGPAEDKDCVTEKWQSTQSATSYDTTKGCMNIVVGNIQPNAWYDFTTCVPVGVGAGSGDPDIVAVTDDQKVSYPVFNADCTDPNAIPNLAGWSCKNQKGDLVMPCASPNAGGFRAGPSTKTFTVSICPKNKDLANGGRGSFHIWYNATVVPQ